MILQSEEALQLGEVKQFEVVEQPLVVPQSGMVRQPGGVPQRGVPARPKSVTLSTGQAVWRNRSAPGPLQLQFDAAMPEKPMRRRVPMGPLSLSQWGFLLRLMEPPSLNPLAEVAQSNRALHWAR